MATIFSRCYLRIVLRFVVVLAIVVDLEYYVRMVSFCVHWTYDVDSARRHYFDAMAHDYYLLISLKYIFTPVPLQWGHMVSVRLRFDGRADDRSVGFGKCNISGSGTCKL